MKTIQLLLFGATVLLPIFTSAAPIDKAVFTEVVNKVSVLERATKKSSPAQLQQTFAAPNVLRTGPDSRAEMVAEDQTVTRVGQNTIFAFQPNGREIDLEKGSILFQSPSGKGGGTIRTSAASAAVLGTTIIVSATANGGFKVLLVEGKGRVSRGGVVRMLNAGQMVYALPGGALSGVFNFQLREQTASSKLIRGFKKSLPSLGKIAAAIAAQERDIASGKVRMTGLLASGSPEYAYRIDTARETQFVKKDEVVVETPDFFAAAVGSNAVIARPLLDSARLFGPGLNENKFPSAPVLLGLLDTPQATPGRQNAQAPAVFLGNNITFNTDTVNLAQFAGRDLVQFFSTGDTTISKSVDFSPYNGQLVLSAGGTISNAQEAVLTASSPLFALLAFGHATAMTDLPLGESDVFLEKPLTLERLSLVNRTGAVFVGGGKLALGAFQVAAPGNVSIRSKSDLLIDRARDVSDIALLDLFSNDGPLPSGYSNISSGTFVQIDGTGDGRIRNTGISAPRINVSQRNLTLERVRLSDGTALNPDGTNDVNGPMPRAATVRLSADNFLSASGVRFNASDVYLQARTISLADVNFRAGSRVWLESQLGILANAPNSNAPLEPGKVNFIRNVRYGGNAIRSPQDSVILQNGLPSGAPTPQTPGIVIRPRR